METVHKGFPNLKKKKILETLFNTVSTKKERYQILILFYQVACMCTSNTSYTLTQHKQIYEKTKASLRNQLKTQSTTPTSRNKKPMKKSKKKKKIQIQNQGSYTRTKNYQKVITLFSKKKKNQNTTSLWSPFSPTKRKIIFTTKFDVW